MASNLWVAVGSGGTGNRIVTSADGTTWTSTGSTVIVPNAIAYKNRLWVAVGGTGNSIATSTDGVLWTGRGTTIFSGGYGYSVAFGNNLWVAAGSTSPTVYSIATSTDGITWTSRTCPIGFAFGVAYGKDGSGNGLWVAVGGHPSLPNTIATSTNGSTWTLRSGFGYRSGLGVAYGRDGLGNGLWVAVGSIQVLGEPAIMTSSDGITWMGRNSTILNSGNGVAYGQDGSGVGLWVVVGRALSTNSIATSYDGITWTGRTGATGVTGQGKSVTYANGLWVATFMGANSIATSTNGINWTVKNNPLIDGAYGVVGPTKATLLTNYYLPTKKMGDASFNIIPPTSNNYGAITYTSSNTAVATIVGSKINVVGVGTSTITAVQEETFSYLSGTNTATFQVIQSTVGTETVLTDFSVPTKIIGDTSFHLVAPTTNSDGSFVYTSSNTAVATIVGSTVTIVGVGTSTISAIQLMSSDYATATVTAPFVVNQITPVLSNFSVPTKTFGDVSFGIVAPTTNGNGSFSYASSDTTVATISGDRITVVGGGSSTITATQASTTNYTSATTTATLTVNQATTVLSNFSIDPKTIADASFTIPSITTNRTGLFSYTSSDPTVATIAGNVATIVGIGSATITADQASNANFLAATISTTLSVSRNLWVAVGSGTENTVASSYDGIVWKGLGLGGAPQSIAYSNNLWVAVGSGANTVAYSTTNGNKWFGFGRTVFSTRGYRILYDPDAALWIAIGQGGNSIATSTTPKTSWTGQGLIFPSATCVYGPATNYSGVQNFSGYLLGGYSTGSLLANSLDGTTWQMGTTSGLASQGFNTIAYGNGVYVAGGTPIGTGNSFATSTDQITWTGRGGSTLMTNVNQITYSNGIFIAVGTKGTAGSTIMKSTDGITWTNLTNVYASYWGRCVAYYQGRWVVGGVGNYGINYSDDNGTTWTLSSTSSYSIYSTQTNAIAYGNDIVVSVGQGTVNTLAISTNLGISWTGKGLLLSGSGNDIKYIDGLWLAVGGDNVSTGNIIVKSTDNGTTWTQVATSSTSYFTSLNSVQNVNGTWYISGRGAYYLAYSNTSNPASISDFVMVSTVSFTTNGASLSTFNYQKPRYIVGGKGMKGSVTGLSWFDILNQPFTTVNDVYWNGTIWVGVGSGRNTLGYSYDGINWVGIGATIFTTSGNNVYYSTTNSLWIATGTGTNTLATSVDGINWTGRGTTVFTTAGGRITYYNNLLVAVGSGPSMIATSTNGISWDTNARITTGRTVAYINNQWIVAGDGTTFATSTDGNIWRDLKPTITNGVGSIYSIAYGNGRWVGVGYGKMMHSTDGINWTGSASNGGINGYVYKVAYGQDGSGNGLWVAAGSGYTNPISNSIATSTDGITWTSRNTNSIFPFNSNGSFGAYGVAYGNGLWIAVGYGTGATCSIATSTNGITWTSRNSTGLRGGMGVAYGNGLWVVVGASGTLTSTDGITWTGRSSYGYYNVGYNVAYGNGLWVSVGSGQSFTSPDGITWTARVHKLTSGYDVAYSNGLWVICGYLGSTSSFVSTSTDGITWTLRNENVFTSMGFDVVGPADTVTKITTVLSNFSVPVKTFGDASFGLVPPTTNSDGVITYTSSNPAVATIVDNVVTIVRTGSSTITAYQANTANYSMGAITATFTVNKITTVLSNFAVLEKTFADAPFNLVAPTTNSDSPITYTSSNTAVATVSGSRITIVGGGTATITATQATTAIYTTGTIATTLTVNQATTILSNFSAITKTFGNAAFALVAPTTNSTGSFTYTSSNPAVATIAGSTVTIVGTGTATITAMQASNVSFLAQTITTTMTVSQATPTITNFSVPAKVTENAPFTIVNPTSNSSGAFTYTSSDTSVATMDGSMVTIVGKGTSTITATQASTTNYLSGSIIATFIVRLTHVITNFSAITKTFGDTSFSIVAPTTDSDGAITYTSSNTAVATVSGTTITIVSAGISTITASQSLTANYVSGTITTTLTVNKATPTITNFSAITKTFGNAAFSIVAPTSNSTGAFTYTSSNTAVATIAGSTVTIVGVGTATITATQATTTNYLAGTTTTTLTVNKATPILSNFSAITKTFGNAAFSIAAPTSNSAGSFTYTSSNTAVATIAGSTVTIVGVGTATITASQADTTNYLAGTTTATMTVSQAPPTITIFDVPAKAIGTAPFSLVTPTSNSSSAFTYTSSNTSVARIDGSMVTIVGLGNTTITAVQASTTNYLSGSITGILAIMVNVPLSIAVGSGENSIATSIDRGLTWNGRGTTVFTNSGSYVAFGKDGSGNNLLVAVGSGGNTIATSTNGTTWIGRGASVFTTQGIGVTYANNLWVAVGQGTNSIATSPDGIVWTGRTGTSIFSNQGIGVAFNNGLWVAVGQGTNSIATSPDGVVWTGRTGTSIFSNQGIGVTFNNGLWVAVGDGTNTIATSTNGTVWTGRGRIALSGLGRGVAYGNGLWVAVGQGTNSIATSPDGITWTGRTGTSIFSNQGIGVAFNSGVWIAVGQGTNSIATSPDGTVWTGRGTSIFSTSGFGVAVGIITPPNITGISPSSGAIVGGTNVTITGTNFTGATSVTFDGISVTSLNIVNSTTITCITPARSAGAVGIIVTTEDGPSGEFSSFTYITPPSITGISPSSGSTAGGTSVTITGTSFIGVTSVTFDGLAATTINMVNSTTITCITPARSVGDVDIIVTTLYGTSNTFSPFTYITPPNITSISQLTGSTAGETNVTIRGTNFTGAISVTFGGLAATSLSVVNSTTITCITPARTAGAVDIIVTTGGGPSGAFSSFTYITPPRITDISPSSGSTIGGTIVTITGTNFTGATSVTFGGLVATNINVVNSTTITCITRDRTAGTGAVDIIVTTGGGPSDAFSSYTYITPPVVTSISPLTGSTAGGTSVTITGTSFTGATLVTFGGLSATSLSVVNSTTITCITPVRSTGAVGIIVKTLYGTSVAFSSFTYITPPVISRISSSSGGIAGGTNVTITGRNFTGATLVTFGGIAATSLSIVNSTTITCITPANSAGAVGIIVTTGGGPSGVFSSFTYITPPNITGISPLTGSTAGGTNVTITGTSFTGATSVTFDGIAATSLSVVDSTTITCITPAHISEGVVGIIVTTLYGTSNTFSSFTYITPPVISSISSSFGSTLGGTNVTITGTNFTGATSVTFGGLSATSLSIVDSTTISCITPARTTAGDVGIIVTTGGGPSGAFSSFTYITPPNITSISPPSGSITGGTRVTIIGTNFTGATSVTFGGIAATTINVVNSTTITCITPAHNAGAVDIIVTTGGGSSGAFSSFTYITSSVISSISPSSGSTAGGTNVTITGINFTGATSVTFDGLAATTINVVNSTTITCITPAHSDGAVGIIVTTGGGSSDAFSSFTYITPASITDISPSSGINTGGTSVTITGTNFTGATLVTFGGVAATSLSIVNNTTITCITPAVLSDGAVGIIVTTGGGPSSVFSSFTYITSPVISSISPSSGGITGGTNVTITGINFTGATSVSFDGIAATSLSVVDSTTITCITPAHNAGAVGIIVTTEGGPSGEFSSFTYITPPNITGILSSSGSTLGGTNVTITGTNFTGATSVTFGGIAATSLSIVNNTTITCITPAHSDGAVGIIVTTDGGSSGEFLSFTYITPPNITDISQLTGSTAGGTNVTITGTSFTGATSVTFGGLSATSLSIVDSTTITCITPAHITGDVDIIVTTGGGPSGAFSSFTYITPPNITSISQLTGSTLGGTSVTITGTSFIGATSVTFDGIAATSLSIVDGTTITCITPAHNAGAVGIIVTTGGGPGNTFSPFTYITPPNITSISQLTGSTLGGTNVTITGTSFTGATSVTFDGIAATSLSIVDGTTITCITPSHSAGNVGIIVTTEYGSSDAFSSFTYITPPVITSISPLTGSTAGGTNVTITGTSFTGATSVTFDGLAATSLSVVNSNTITCITPAHSDGDVNIIVTTLYGTSNTFSSFTYIAPPNITGISQLTGSTAGGTSVTITGTSFTGATLVTFGGLAATSLSIVDSTTITCITPARATVGAVGVIVTTGGGSSNTFSSFTYIVPPNIKSISPSSVSIVGGTIVTITGTNFIGATSVKIDGLNATSFNVVNNTSITCITPARTTGGMVGLIVTTGGGPSNTFSTFIYSPFVSAILPAFGTRSGGTGVKITGVGFTGATSVTFGGIPATNVFVFNPTTITCRTPPGIVAEAVGVIVSTRDGPSNTFSSFTYITPPNITGISPSYGGTVGGTIVTITGKSFTGVSSVLFGGLKVKSLKVINDTTITCVTAARPTPVPVDITVQNSIGISNVFSSYTYIMTPKLTSISPNFGSTTGGNTVTIIGTDFIGATEVTVGDLSCSSFTVIDNNTLTCITPARIAPGPVGIIVTTGGGPTKKSSPFTYIVPPVIISISPPFGGTTGGNVVTITGVNFKGASSVLFGGLSATTVKAVNDTTITCRTPVSISAGPVDVIVRTGGGPSNTFSPFTYITPPVISDISPPAGSTLGGNIVTITGTNLTGATSVLFGKAASTNITVVNDTTLTCRTPLNKAGAPGVIVRTGGGPSTIFPSFTFVTPPSISSVLPLSGSTNGGTLVTLKGKTFTGATSVTIGGVEATSFTVVSDILITCITPARSGAGGVGIIVTTAGGPSKQFSFFNYITPPVITSLSPSTGSTAGGTIVTITGTNFTGATSVTINGKAATPIKVVDNTTITCKAPINLTAGPVDVIVTTGGGPSSAFSSYTYVTPAVITSISPTFGTKVGGTSVTITGTNFTGASNLLFGLKSATNVNVVNNTTITCVTPDSANPVAVGITLTTGGGLSNKFSSFTYR